ncbi:MAG: glycosyltransferase family 2 protein [Bauldia sp.]
MTLDDPNVGGPTPTPWISVVIPARNAAATIGRTLGSLVGERDLITEILIVDDGSNDRTGAIARDRGRELQLPVEVIPVTLENAGAARNVGIKRSRGDLLFLIDADDELIPGGLAVLARNLRSRPDADLAVGGYIRRIEGAADKQRMPRPFQENSRRNAHDYLTNRQRSIAMGSALVRRRAVPEAAFPESVAFDEDTLFWAAILSSARVVTVDSPVLLYNADAGRMERRFIASPHRDYMDICRELDKLARYGIDARILDWRKDWLAWRVIRALIRQGQYAEASDFMRLVRADDRRIRYQAKGLWYWAKIRLGVAWRRPV